MGTVVIHAEKIMVIGDPQDCLLVVNIKGPASEFYRAIVVRCPRKHHDLYRLAFEAKAAEGTIAISQFLDYLSEEGHHYVKVWRPYHCDFMITYQAPDEEDYLCHKDYIIMNMDDSVDATIVQRVFDYSTVELNNGTVTPFEILNRLADQALISSDILTSHIK